MGATANAVYSAAVDVTTGVKRTLAEAEPVLALLLPGLDESVQTLEPLVGNVAAEDASQQVREALEDDDGVFDDGHRFVFGAFNLCETRGSQEERATVVKGRTTLYPVGLSGIQASYNTEVDDTQAYKNRLQNPVVRAALDIVEKVVPEVVTTQKAIVVAASSMRANLTRLDQLQAKAKATPSVRELFEARRDAFARLANFAANVEFTFRGTDPAQVEKREMLLSKWRRINAGPVGSAETPLDLVTDEDETSVSEIPTNN